jgi:hypothetical protein
MFWFLKLDCPVLAYRTYDSLNLIFVNLPSCASRITCSHILFCCTLRMHTYTGSSLGFSLKICKMASLGQIWILFNMHIFRGSQLYTYESKNAYWIFFESFNQGLSSITKKGEIKSASRPLVDFGVLNDNLIKWLISCIKWIRRF